MAQDSNARKLYEQRKTLQRQLDTLDNDKIQPFIVDLYQALPPIWRDVLARNNILTRVFEFGKAQMVFNIGPGSHFSTEGEAVRECSKLQELLAEHMVVALGRESSLIELTFILDPRAI